jgi:hypothetical protein
VNKQHTLSERKDILTRTYQLDEHAGVPLLVQPFAKWYATGDLMQDWSLDLSRQTRRHQEQEPVIDFTVPHLKTGIGLGGIAASIVGNCEWNDKSDAWIEPVIGKQPQRVYDLQLPDPRTSGRNPLIFERIRQFQMHSDLPLQPSNMASPLTTASYVWGYSDFLQALVEHPKEIHHLLELVTQATIDAVRAQTAEIRNLWCLSHEDWYMPTEMGIRVSDDVLAVISPKHYREFGVHYNNILSREFGGIIIHSCGSITRQIPTILETKDLRAIDLALPHNDLQKLSDAAAGKVAMTMRYWIQDWENRPMPDLVEYTHQAVETLGTRGVLLQMETPTLAEAIRLSHLFSEEKWTA